jgi:DNA-binding NarL/FixJ family response regulator
MPSSAPAVRVLVVDDSAPFREAARQLIEFTRGFAFAGEAGDGERGVAESLRLQPDLVLMDLRMPGIGGVEAARRMLAQTPAPLVVLVTGADVPEDVPDGAVILPKQRLNPAALRQIWERSAPPERAVAGRRA